MADEDWHKVLAVNLSGAFFMSKAALEHMLERGTGRIMNISSIVGQIGNIGQANYAASKSGLFGLTMTLATEAAFALKKADKLDPDGVGMTVNAVAPGFIETEMLATVPEKVLDGSAPRSRSAASAGRTRSPGWCTSWPRTRRATSPGRCGRSTAARTCDVTVRRGRRARPVRCLRGRRSRARPWTAARGAFAVRICDENAPVRQSGALLEAVHGGAELAESAEGSPGQRRASRRPRSLLGGV